MTVVAGPCQWTSYFSRLFSLATLQNNQTRATPYFQFLGVALYEILIGLQKEETRFILNGGRC
jgi:hypothetical protein